MESMKSCDSLNFIRLLRVVFSSQFSEGVITTRSNRMKFRLKLGNLRSFSRTSFSFHKVSDCKLFNFYDSFFNWPLSDLTSHHTVKLTYIVCPARADVNQMPMQTRFSLVIDILRIMQKRVQFDNY